MSAPRAGAIERPQALIERAREVFAGIAARHTLRLEWDQHAPTELACRLPTQPGLDFTLWLNLQNVDEIGFRSDIFSAAWFPSDKITREAAFIEAVDGLIAGTMRLHCFYNGQAETPSKVQLQRLRGCHWNTVYTYRRGILWPAQRKTRIVINRPFQSKRIESGDRI